MRWLVSMTTAIVIVSVDVSAHADSPGGGTTQTEGSSRSGTGELPPEERLDRAETAFRRAEFGQIPDLLRPTVEPESKFDDVNREIRARELLGVGYYLTAQRVTDADERDRLLTLARGQFLALLRLRPDYQLDPMVFPASVVELFEEVRQKHSDELKAIRRRRTNTQSNAAASSTPIYIERSYKRRPYAVNFFPLGVGLFQNGRPVRGGLYAAGQVAAVATIGVGTAAIESLRNPETGRFERGEVYLRARRWRQAQWIAAGTFAAIYAASVVDSLLSYRRVGDVDIRTLDEPPPELDDQPSNSTPSLSPRLRILPGGLQIQW